MTLTSPCLALLIRLLLCLPLIVDAFYIDCFNGFIPIKFSSRSSITNTIIFSGPWPHQTECLVSSASAGARTLRSFPRALLPTTSGRNRSLSSSLLNDMIPKTIGVSRHSGMMLSQYWLIRILLLRSLGFVSIFAFLIALHQNKALIGNSGITPALDILYAAEERAKKRHQRRIEWEEERKNYRYNRYSKGTAILRFYDIPNVIRRSSFFPLVQKYLIHPFHRYLWDRTDSLDRPLLTLLWFGFPNQSSNKRYSIDHLLDGIAYLGLTISCILVTKGAANVPLLALLWICQQSLMSVGGPWYGFGWETMLAELTFHLIFMVPMFSMSSFPIHTPVPKVTILSLRWFIFRIMIGSGLIKLRSKDNKWKDLTVMNYFYETMPVPNMLTRYFHRMPQSFHKFETLVNHFVELVVPWFLILPCPRNLRIAAATIQILFQCLIIACGNFSFLNWLTMIPALACLDDAAILRLNSFSKQKSATAFTRTYALLCEFGGSNVSFLRTTANLLFAITVAKLSIPVVKNLLSKQQKMNSSFDKLRLINSYGAFGVVNEERIELIVSSASDYNGPWKEYSFKVKPGNTTRRPRWISPYHYRLDWQMWIASCSGGIDRSPWMYMFLLKLLQEDKAVLHLLDDDPWRLSGSKPKYIRVEKFRYKFAYQDDQQNITVTSNETFVKPYWTREYEGRFFPRQGILSQEMLQDILRKQLH